MTRGQKFTSLLVLLTIWMGAPRNAGAVAFHMYIFESLNGLTYGVFSNDDTDSIDHMTQLVVNTVGITGLTGSSGGIQETFELSPSSYPFVDPIAQSGIIPSRLKLGGIQFDALADGTIFFDDGSTLTLGDMGAFTGAQTSLDSTSTVFASTFALYPPGTTFTVDGFNVPPGGHPTSRLPMFGSGPTDGIALPHRSSVVFAWGPHPTTGWAIGGAAIVTNDSNTVIGGAGNQVTRSPTPVPPPSIPEPSTLFLLASGFLSIVGYRSTSRKPL